MTGKKKEKLIAVPKPSRRPAGKATGKTRKDQAPVDVQPDLSHIHEDIRHLAMPLSELNFDPKNSRVHDEKNVLAVEASLRQFGQDQPLVVQKQGMIVRKGNCRMAAGLRLGYTHLAALIVDESDPRATARAVADNRSAELASWNVEMLHQNLREMGTGLDPDLDRVMSELAVQQGIVPAEDKPSAKQPAVPTQYCVLVTCADEERQTELLKRLQAEGYKCKAS